ncbi:MAG: YgjV family protein [Lachnospiraceae bacterium]|nr:YgjV family protein [Lachnospiraceae bacterium]
MNNAVIIEGIGYLGSFLVVVSMLMTSVKKLRIVNTVGSAIFTTYALIIHSYPTALMNLCLIIINLYQLYRLGQKEEHFKLISAPVNTGAVPYIMESCFDDIKKYFPDLDKITAEKCDAAYLVTYDLTPAGLMLGNRKEDGSIDVLFDYATPAYRDCSVGDYLYRHLPEEGIKKLVFAERSEGHEGYMKKMGFVKDGNHYIKEL